MTPRRARHPPLALSASADKRARRRSAEQVESGRRRRKEDTLSTRIRPTTDQALAGAVAGHRMAGMEPSPEASDITRRFAEGLLTRDQALAGILAAVRERTAGATA